MEEEKTGKNLARAQAKKVGHKQDSEIELSAIHMQKIKINKPFEKPYRQGQQVE